MDDGGDGKVPGKYNDDVGGRIGAVGCTMGLEARSKNVANRPSKVCHLAQSSAEV